MTMGEELKLISLSSVIRRRPFSCHHEALISAEKATKKPGIETKRSGIKAKKVRQTFNIRTYRAISASGMEKLYGEESQSQP